MPRKSIAVASLLLFSTAVLAGISSRSLHAVMMHLVIITLALIVARQLALLVFAACDPRRAPSLVTDTPLVSVIVPAYNEAQVIRSALASVLTIDYPNLEIIVVDDGSTDATSRRARALAGRTPERKVRVFSQANSGKGSALNLGIEHARGKFVLCVDADSRLQPDAIRRGLSYFSDPAVAAVGGGVEVANLRGPLALFQQLEYMVCLNFTRRALSYFGAVTVIPGPIGLFRRDALVAVGGYDERRDMFAEDAELTVRLLSRGWRIKGDTSMIARTQVPQDMFSLLRQRYRWKRGLFQAFDANVLPLLLLPGFRGFGITLFLGLECFLLDLLNFTVFVFFLTHVLAHWELKPMLAAYALIIGMELAALLVACRGKGFFRNAGLLLVQRITYANILQAWGILALLDEWRSTRMDWDKLERMRGVEGAS
ncbi:MAG TPA: glycosyltransferase [Steroidobacteraceae bacterium]|nr:glycosyltransferase [Steroidobacteraceae bacterium]